VDSRITNLGKGTQDAARKICTVSVQMEDLGVDGCMILNIYYRMLSEDEARIHLLYNRVQPGNLLTIKMDVGVS
jgi:hypothetical protein